LRHFPRYDPEAQPRCIHLGQYATCHAQGEIHDQPNHAGAAEPVRAGEAGLRFARTVTVSGAGRITCGAAHVDSVVDDFGAAFNSAILIL
jgi:hypothetical protein